MLNFDNPIRLVVGPEPAGGRFFPVYPPVFKEATSDSEKLLPSERVELSADLSVTLRPAAPDDVLVILEMHNRLSADSIYLRYFQPYKPRFEDIARVVAQPEGTVWLATLEPLSDQVIGIAYYSQDPGETQVAEPAVLVEDRYQGRGVGGMLIGRLVEQARFNGIRSFQASIHPTNLRMLRIVNHGGLPVRQRFVDGVREVIVDLQPV